MTNRSLGYAIEKSDQKYHDSFSIKLPLKDPDEGELWNKRNKQTVKEHKNPRSLLLESRARQEALQVTDTLTEKISRK